MGSRGLGIGTREAGKALRKEQLLARLRRHWEKTTGDNRRPEQRQQTQHVQQITNDEAQ